MTSCTVLVERQEDGRYRAWHPWLPDAHVVAGTAEEARNLFEQTLARQLLHRGQKPFSSEQRMNPIETAFLQLRDTGRKAFIPFVTAGDPDLSTTGQLIARLADHGAAIIEVGFPYSDPIADGAVIQASYTRALNKGIQLDRIFEHARRWADSTNVPLAAMVSYSLVHRRGEERFLDQSRAAGFSGLIVPDLPAEEASKLATLATARQLTLTQLVTPTTPRDRATQIAALSTGFLYCVSVTGITGERQHIPSELLDQLRWLRQQTTLPLCAGFGISRPEHVRMLRDVVDGVIVGSAIVRLVEQLETKAISDVLRDVDELIDSLVGALNS